MSHNLDAPDQGYEITKNPFPRPPKAGQPNREFLRFFSKCNELEEVKWVPFRTASPTQRLDAVEVIWCMKRDPDTGQLQADKLVITNRYRRKDSQTAVGYYKLNMPEVSEAAAMVAWIQQTCTVSNIPVTRHDHR